MRHQEGAVIVSPGDAGQLTGFQRNPERLLAPTGGIPGVDEADGAVGFFAAVKECLGFEAVGMMIGQDVILVGLWRAQWQDINERPTAVGKINGTGG